MEEKKDSYILPELSLEQYNFKEEMLKRTKEVYAQIEKYSKTRPSPDKFTHIKPVREPAQKAM